LDVLTLSYIYREMAVRGKQSNRINTDTKLLFCYW